MNRMLFFLFVTASLTFVLQARKIYLPANVHIWDGFERSPEMRKSCAPYISGDTFRSFCDHVFDETKMYLDLDVIKPGDSIFLVADTVPYFFQEVYKHIEHPFVLVTHNRDDSMPGDFVSYLDDENIIAWFAVNTDRYHPKLFTIPIGIANSYWPHGNPDVIKRQSLAPANKNVLLCASYVMPTHASREQIYAYFRRMPFCYFPDKKLHDQYLFDLRRAKFVLSPRGNGIDCHRTWEALYMGAIPIVPSTSINSVYEDLPIIIVDDWTVITTSFLDQKWAEYNQKIVNLEKLYAEYWFNFISQYQNLVRNR